MIFNRKIRNEIKKQQNEVEVAALVEKINNEQEQEKEASVHEISYTRATFWKRCSVILFDLICCFMLSMGCFIGIRAAVDNSPNIKEANAYLYNKKMDSHLFSYVKEKNKFFSCVEFLNMVPDARPETNFFAYENNVNDFFTFLAKEIGEEETKIYYDDFNNLKFSDNCVKDGIPLFIKKPDGSIVENPNEAIKYDDLNKLFFEPYIEEIAIGIFFAKIPHVYENQKLISNMLFYVEIPISLFIGFLVIYYIIPLIFYRGKQTLGRLAFHTGLVDKNVLSVKFGRFTARFAILFFVEVILSIFTLGVPIFVSFSLMAFSKKKQNFHDYMLGIEEVDVTNDKIYKSMDELIQKPTKYDLDNFNPLTKE